MRILVYPIDLVTNIIPCQQDALHAKSNVWLALYDDEYYQLPATSNKTEANILLYYMYSIRNNNIILYAGMMRH